MLLLSLLSMSKDATNPNPRTKATLRRRGSSLSHALTVLCIDSEIQGIVSVRFPVSQVWGPK